jgi:hypothetical protein
LFPPPKGEGNKSLKMKYILIIFISALLFAFPCQAKYEDDSIDVISEDTILPPYKESIHNTITAYEFYYSSKVFNNQFYNSFNQIDHINFQLPLNEIGIGLSGRICVGSMSSYDNQNCFDGQFSYKAIIPVKLTINDTLISTISGSTISINCGKDLYFSSSNFDLIISGGLDFGRIVLTNSAYKTQKNPFFSPTVSITPRVKIKHFVMSLKIDCWNDISKASWRPTLISRLSKENSYSINNFRQSGIRFSIGIGYSFK